MKIGLVYRLDRRGRIGIIPEWSEFPGTIREWIEECRAAGQHPVEVARIGEGGRMYRVSQVDAWGDAGDIFLLVNEWTWNPTIVPAILE